MLQPSFKQVFIIRFVAVIILFLVVATSSFTPYPAKVFHTSHSKPIISTFSSNHKIMSSAACEPILKKAKVEDSEGVKPEVSDNKEEKEIDKTAEEKGSTVEVLKNDKGESYVDISAKKRVTVRKWNDNVLIDIREVSLSIHFVYCLYLWNKEETIAYLNIFISSHKVL